MDNWKKIILIIFFTTTINANVLTVRWPYTKAATDYTIHLGREPGIYQFNFKLPSDHYKNNFVYSFLFLENGVTYYISYSYEWNGWHVKSGDLKVTAPVIFPKTPVIRVK
jgi:hypothetical protein